MIIDFNDIEETRIKGFKGGQGELLTRNYADEKVRIMKSILRPGASSGPHMHEGNCEIMYILKGELTYHYDEKTEVARAGQVHYCPTTHHHYFENLTAEDVEYLAIVPEHH